MKKKFLLIFSLILCLLLAFVSCNDEEGDDSHSHSHSSSTITGSTPSDSSGSGVIPAKTPCIMNEKGHYWYDVSIDTGSGISGSAVLSGRCYLCGDNLIKEVITLVDYEEWQNALTQGLASFTVNVGSEYTDYDQSSSFSWRINDGVFTQDFFINSKDKTSTQKAKDFESFLLPSVYNSFTYNAKTKTYVYVSQNATVELGFADGKLLSHSVTSTGENSKKSTTLYLNHDRVSVSTPQYFFDSLSYATSRESINKSTLSTTMKEKLASVFSSLSFDGYYEISYLENGGLSVYFSYESPKNDSVFGEAYSSLTIVISEDKVVSVSFGTSTVEISY